MMELTHEEMLAAINEAGWTILPDDRAAVAATYARLVSLSLS